MNTQLKVLLAFNAVMFSIAGILEWQYYTAHQVDSQSHRAELARYELMDKSRSPPIDLEELHRSFQNALPRPVNVSLSNALVTRRVAGSAQLRRIKGDGSGKQLTNAAVVLVCYNRYCRASACFSISCATASLPEDTKFICNLYATCCCMG